MYNISANIASMTSKLGMLWKQYIVHIVCEIQKDPLETFGNISSHIYRQKASYAENIHDGNYYVNISANIASFIFKLGTAWDQYIVHMVYQYHKDSLESFGNISSNM